MQIIHKYKYKLQEPNLEHNSQRKKKEQKYKYRQDCECKYNKGIPENRSKSLKIPHNLKESQKNEWNPQRILENPRDSSQKSTYTGFSRHQGPGFQSHWKLVSKLRTSWEGWCFWCPGLRSVNLQIVWLIAFVLVVLAPLHNITVILHCARRYIGASHPCAKCSPCVRQALCVWMDEWLVGTNGGFSIIGGIVPLLSAFVWPVLLLPGQNTFSPFFLQCIVGSGPFLGLGWGLLHFLLHPSAPGLIKMRSRLGTQCMPTQCTN